MTITAGQELAPKGTARRPSRGDVARVAHEYGYIKLPSFTLHSDAVRQELADTLTGAVSHMSDLGFLNDTDIAISAFVLRDIIESLKEPLPGIQRKGEDQ